MKFLPSSGYTLHTRPYVPFAHLPTPLPFEGWGEMRGWLLVEKSFGYDQKQSFCHMFHTLPSHNSFQYTVPAFRLPASVFSLQGKILPQTVSSIKEYCFNTCKG